MLFAPSTIAIAALILSFSVLRQDCTDWLSSIPNFCLPLSENPLSHNPEDDGSTIPKAHRVFHLFDIDRYRAARCYINTSTNATNMTNLLSSTGV